MPVQKKSLETYWMHHICRLHHDQNTVTNTQTKNLWGKLDVRRLAVHIAVNDTRTRFEIDKGSQVNIIPRKDYHQLKNKSGLKPCRTSLTAYNGTSIPVLGKCVVQIPLKNNIYDVPIFIADTDASPILGQKKTVVTCTSYKEFPASQKKNLCSSRNLKTILGN